MKRYELYTGILKGKIVNITGNDLADLKQRAAVIAACGLHCGIRDGERIVHHTNKEDAEYLEWVKRYEFWYKSNVGLKKNA
ncbi:hypothetical protein LCGC14_0701920 [marine sediment metagenome]|uniref:Uncharacterized protein n=1 Tax=marine sediment metagenome TaxID=412755 RepID=A0A0F9QHH8_9ZZZZ